MDWYKRYPDKWLAGTQYLTLEERGAYATIIDVQYARQGDLPDDERIICEYLSCRPQVWRRLRAALVAKQKLHVLACGKLTANGVAETRNRFETGTKPPQNRPLNGRFQKNPTEIAQEFGPRTRTITRTKSKSAPQQKTTAPQQKKSQEEESGLSGTEPAAAPARSSEAKLAAARNGGYVSLADRGLAAHYTSHWGQKNEYC